MKLSDGTVLSSAFRGSSQPLLHGFDQVKRSTNLKIGTIVAVRYVDSSEGLQKSAANNSEGEEGSAYETVYDIRVDDHNARPVIFNGCRALKPWMGPNNYFEVIHESADIAASYVENGPTGIFAQAAESLVGSRCVVLCIEGEPTAGVILGFLQHPARTSTVTEDMGLHLEFEFNGFNCSIDKDGAFTIEANGPYIDPVSPPVGPVPGSGVRSDPSIGPFSITLDKDMVFTIQDNVDQSFSIDRTAGEITLTNSSETITVSKDNKSITIEVGDSLNVNGKQGTMSLDDSFEIDTKELTINADTSTDITSPDISFSADSSFSIESGQVSIKSNATFEVESQTVSIKGATGELLDLITQLINGLGACTPSSPVGPCAPIQASPQWAQVQAALTKLQGMMG